MGRNKRKKEQAVAVEEAQAVAVVEEEAVGEEVVEEVVAPKIETVAEGTSWQRPKVEITYKCECCAQDFISHRARQGEKLCAECIGLRRSLKSFVKNGLTETEVVKRGRKLLGVKS